jgi:ATP-dependent Lon protease
MDKKQPFTIRAPTFLMGDMEKGNKGTIVGGKSQTMTTKHKSNWHKLSKLLTNISKNKYILLTLIEFLSKFKHHITNHLADGRIQKQEFFNINDLIDNLAQQIHSIRKILIKKNILFFDIIWSQGNVECLTDIYLHILYLIEKYGADTLIYTVNCYLLVYSGLQDIYFLYKNEYYQVSGGMQMQLQHSDTIAQLGSPNATRQPSTTNITNSRLQSSSSTEEDSDSSQDDVLFPISATPNSNGTGKQNKTSSRITQSINKYPSTNYKNQNIASTDNIFNTPQKQVLQVVNNFFTQMALQSTSRLHVNTSHIQTAEILNKLLTMQTTTTSKPDTTNIHNTYSNNSLYNKTSYAREYLELLTNITHIQQLSAFLINGNAQTNMLNTLAMFNSCGILKSKSTTLFNTNPMVSEIYRDLAHRATTTGTTPHHPNCNIWAADITNPLIYTTIPNFDKIRDRVIHIFIQIKIGDSSILFIITGQIYNDNILIGYKYNFTQRQIKLITQSVFDLDDIATGFRANILKLLTPKQMLTGTTQQITTWCYDKWQLYNTVIKMTILELMNYFLSQSITRKRDIITVLILNSAHADSTFRAYILCDLIVDENGGQIEKEVFAGLHISIQCKLRRIQDTDWNSTQDLEDSQKSVAGIKIDELTYEKRIQLLKTDDTVRAKALEKLREINNKSNDNSSKPQQYLDGLLSIPFGTFAKEWIIGNSELILEQSRIIIINFVCICYDYRDMYGWSRSAIDWVAITFGLPGLSAFINGLSSRPASQNGSPSRVPVRSPIRYSTGSPIRYSTGSPIRYSTGSPIQSTTRLPTVTTTTNLIMSAQIEDETLAAKYHDAAIHYSSIEKYLLQKLSLSKCGIGNIRQLSTYLAQQIIARRVLVSAREIESVVLTEALASLDITQLQDIQFELLQEDIKVELGQLQLHNQPGHSISITCPELLDNQAARSIITECLITEGYFYDIGYPTDLIRYLQRVTELIKSHDNHRTDKQLFIQNTRARLDASIYGQREAKDQIVRIIAQWVNGNQDGYCLGFEGSPGLGKTSLAKYGISHALVDANGKSRPFGFIALGGSANGSILEGHSYTYVGSTWGRIADILMQSRCMNPIIFIDELDKISNTESGRELIGILTHLTDRTQNNEFMDKYFAGVKLDLSKVLFIFSYNDYTKLDPILADRIHRVRFENYTISDKVAISRDYLIPRISAEINMSLPISLDADTTEYIINSYTYEAGVRKLKEKYYDIFRELNVRDISGDLDNYALAPHNNSLALTTQMIDSILVTHHKIEIDRPLVLPRIGVVYGLYATGLGIGGLTIIQVSRKLADHGGILLCTGKQGDVMMESMKVALTLACGLVSDSVLEKWGLLSEKHTTTTTTTSPARPAETNSDTSVIETNKNKTAESSTAVNRSTNQKWSFHIHIPDGATSKDGPSAGCAITLGLVSLLLDCPVRNNISMTGEIDMLGHVLPIGGLDAKITGSKLAGIREIMVPSRNSQDLQRIRDRTPEICDGVTIHLVDTIQEVLAHGLVGGWTK